MKNLYRMVIIVSIAVILIGCARLRESARVVWGSSTRALEESRADAATATYACEVYDCFNRALEVARSEKMTVFLSDRARDLIVLMNVPGSINTTEVGIFFAEAKPGITTVEVVSLSTHAQEAVADMLFSDLHKTFSLVH